LIWMQPNLTYLTPNKNRDVVGLLSIPLPYEQQYEFID